MHILCIHYVANHFANVSIYFAKWTMIWADTVCTLIIIRRARIIYSLIIVEASQKVSFFEQSSVECKKNPVVCRPSNIL